MGRSTVRAAVRGLSAEDVFRRIAAFPDYPSLCDAVREVVVVESEDGHMVSEWEVNFHRGILRWTERADFLPQEGLITFSELSGDVEEFSGYWKVASVDGGVAVEFHVEFEVGIPTLEHILDPIAEEALRENVTSILGGLMGDAVTIEPPPSGG